MLVISILALIVAVIALFMYLTVKEQMLNVTKQTFKSLVFIFFGVSIFFFLINGITIVPAGHVGVIDLFGVVSPRILKSGINIVNPFARVIKMSTKTQEIQEIMDVPSKEGLSVKLSVSVLYHLDPEKAADIYKTVGVNYATIILEPQYRSVVRGVTASFEAKALYTSEREHLSTMIMENFAIVVKERGIIVEASPLRSIQLPPGLAQSIEAKLQAEQESQRMEFILQKEKQEAERKRIEARGIADFQKIVQEGISNQLLQWKGIEATERLAASANAKVVIIGAGKSGLPIIFDAKQ